MPARIVFMGSPEYAVPCLEALHEHYPAILVITQPDQKQGRGREICISPVKEAALSRQLDIWQPVSLRTKTAIQRLEDFQPDLYVTAAIGHILTPEILEIPVHGCINVHASLLPRWRGAAPISAAILHGDSETGVTLMKTDPGLDTGPILAQTRCPVEPHDTAVTLTARLARLGADLLIATLPHWLAGEIVPQPQPAEGATYCRRLEKQDGEIDWRQPAALIERMIRAYTPWPGAYTFYRGQQLNVLRARVFAKERREYAPGTVLALNGNVAVQTGKGALVLQTVQLAGKRTLDIDVFCRGQRDLIGARLGSGI
ncbi:MAG: methionyl-tRNA formyltransferase [Anaerolineae bacterium]|nr:methionyl-tRNA formyltransferase [Anaerolineae bacterium]